MGLSLWGGSFLPHMLQTQGWAGASSSPCKTSWGRLAISDPSLCQTLRSPWMGLHLAVELDRISRGINDSSSALTLLQPFANLLVKMVMSCCWVTGNAALV